MAGLFGGRRPSINWGDIGAWAYGGAQGVHEHRNRQRAQVAGVQQTAQEDWLRAQLSPADGPGGSGTGAMPSIEQQMAALQEAQLRNPEVAAQFAPLVQSRRLEGLIGGRPVNEQVATLLNPEKAGEAFATQFRDDVLAPGSVRTRGAETITAAPITQRFDDRWGSIDPMTGGVTYSAPRGPTYAEATSRMQAESGRITAERPQIANLSPGQRSYGVSPDGTVSPLAENTNLTDQQQRAQAQAQAAAQAAEARRVKAQNTRGAVARALGQVNGWTTGPLSGLSRIGGTGAANLAATLDTIEANLSFDALAEMRANSPTGGALGGIAVRELELLGATVANLRQSQSPGQLRENLAIIDQALARLDEVQAIAGEMGQPQAQPAPQASGRVAYDANGRRYVVRDGRWVPE